MLLVKAKNKIGCFQHKTVYLMEVEKNIFNFATLLFYNFNYSLSELTKTKVTKLIWKNTKKV